MWSCMLHLAIGIAVETGLPSFEEWNGRRGEKR